MAGAEVVHFQDGVPHFAGVKQLSRGRDLIGNIAVCVEVVVRCQDCAGESRFLSYRTLAVIEETSKRNAGRVDVGPSYHVRPDDLCILIPSVGLDAPEDLGIPGVIVRIDKVIDYLLVLRVAAGVYDTDPDAVGIMRVNGGR